MAGSGGFWSKRNMLGLGLGQFVSLLITSTGFSSSQLSREGIDAPTSQSLLNYVLLAAVYGGVMLYRRRWPQTKWYYYLLLGLVDVEANYLVVKAYQYTSLTSVMLLDCWTIPSVILLTWLFLKTKYGFRKFAGVGVCVAGLVLVVFSDVHASDRAGGPKPIKGDVLVIVGSMLYAVSNVSEEFLVKNGDRVELMAMLGLFGALISACQISILERNELKSIHWTSRAAVPFLGFALAMFVFYSTVPFVLKIAGSTMLNLSLLTSDMWAVLIRIFAYHDKHRGPKPNWDMQKSVPGEAPWGMVRTGKIEPYLDLRAVVDWLYFVAFAGVAVGLAIYSRGAKVEEDAVLESKPSDPEATATSGVQESSSALPEQKAIDGNGHSSSPPPTISCGKRTFEG